MKIVAQINTDRQDPDKKKLNSTTVLKSLEFLDLFAL